MKLVYVRRDPQPLKPGQVKSTDTREPYDVYLQSSLPNLEEERVLVAVFEPSHWIGPTRPRWGIKLRGQLQVSQPDYYVHSYQDTLTEAKEELELTLLKFLSV